MPLQSGNNKQLKEMRRRYKRELYAQRVAKIKELMPHCCIGVDVIVGFPNETEEDFLETYKFVNELDISYLHVFTYSERPNTPAAEMPNPVSIQERRRRNQMLTILSEKKRRYFYENHLNEVRPVLFEKAKERGMMSGFTDNYIKIEVPMKESYLNEIRPVKLLEIGDSGNMKIEHQAMTEMAV
jgi:threonylcarbamoyladenosine tRNA methylthiotransferase MtaB